MRGRGGVGALALRFLGLAHRLLHLAHARLPFEPFLLHRPLEACRVLLDRSECAARAREAGLTKLGTRPERRRTPHPPPPCAAPPRSRRRHLSRRAPDFIVFTPVLWDVGASARSANERSTPARSRANVQSSSLRDVMSIEIWLARCIDADTPAGSPSSPRPQHTRSSAAHEIGCATDWLVSEALTVHRSLVLVKSSQVKSSQVIQNGDRLSAAFGAHRWRERSGGQISAQPAPRERFFVRGP